MKTQRQRNLELWENTQSLEDNIADSLYALEVYGQNYDTWVVASSGGKDSTATALLVANAIIKGLVSAPKRMVFCYSDTRRELPPLHDNVISLFKKLEEYGFETKIVMPDLEHRFWTKVLGIGVPPPIAAKRLYCKYWLKIDPMDKFFKTLDQSKMMLITGVRTGESHIRDMRLKNYEQLAKEMDDYVAPSCSKDGGECGTGLWLNPKMDKGYRTLPIIAHWRACNVYDYNANWVDATYQHDFKEWGWKVCKEYGMTDEGELAQDSRFGCFGCGAVEAERDSMIKRYSTRHDVPLAPLQLLRKLIDEMYEYQYRHVRDTGTAMIIGPLSVESRLYFLNRIIEEIQTPTGLEIINQEEKDYILKCHEDGRFPINRKCDWNKDLPLASESDLDKYKRDGGQMVFDMV